MAQSNPLIYLAILSADCVPGFACGHKLERSERTAPNSHPSPKNRGAFHAPTPQGIQQKTQIRPPHSKKNKKSPDLVDSFSIFRNRAMATQFGILSDLQKKGDLDASYGLTHHPSNLLPADDGHLPARWYRSEQLTRVRGKTNRPPRITGDDRPPESSGRPPPRST